MKSTLLSGKPVQCTGLLTSEIYNIFKVDSHCVLNKISKARLYSPEGKFLELKLGKPNIVVDRELFDKQIASMAESSGVKINLNSKFTGISGLLEKKAVINGKPIDADWIIGADDRCLLLLNLLACMAPARLSLERKLGLR